MEVVRDLPGSQGVQSAPGKVIAAGFRQTGDDVIITDSFLLNPTPWRVFARNFWTTAANVTIDAICMTTDPGTVIAKANKSLKVASKKAR